MGFELTIRTPRVDEAPPMWPVNLLLNLAGYVHRNGKVLTPGHWFDAGPVTDTADSDVTGYGFVADIDLEPIDTPHGRVEFLQVVGLRPEELRLWAEDGAEAWLTIARERLPGLLTEPRRPSLL